MFSINYCLENISVNPLLTYIDIVVVTNFLDKRNPCNIYLFKVKKRNTKRSVKYVQN